MIDFASSQGGTSTIGKCSKALFSANKWIKIFYTGYCPHYLKNIKKQLLRSILILERYWVYNSGRRIDTEELSLACRKLYLLILNTFPCSPVAEGSNLANSANNHFSAFFSSLDHVVQESVGCNDSLRLAFSKFQLAAKMSAKSCQ